MNEPVPQHIVANQCLEIANRLLNIAEMEIPSMSEFIEACEVVYGLITFKQTFSFPWQASKAELKLEADLKELAASYYEFEASQISRESLRTLCDFGAGSAQRLAKIVHETVCPIHPLYAKEVELLAG